MTFTLFIALLMAFAVVTSYVTEAVKKVLDGLGAVYASNIVVLIVSMIVGGAGTIIAYILLGVAINFVNILCAGLMAIAVWMCAMLGYDKVLQMVEQFGNIKR